MTQTQKISLFLLRISLGWVYFYAGITKVLDPNWSAAGYLQGAKTFTGFYQWLASPGIIPFINFINEWGLTLLGLSLIFGFFVRWTSLFGILLMVMYYFPVLQFPYPNKNSLIVDEHVIYSLVLFFFTTTRVGKIWGLENLFCKK